MGRLGGSSGWTIRDPKPGWRVVEFQGIGRDVTDRKRAEQAVDKSEARSRALFGLLAVGAATMTPTEGRYLSVNDAFCRATGYSRDELIGESFLAITDPGDRERNLQTFECLVRGEISEYRVETRYIRKDGQVIWVQADVTLARDDEDRPLHAVALVQDITERQRAHEALRASEERYRSLVEQASDALFVADARGRFLDANTSACLLTGYGREELLGRRIAQFVAGERKARRRVLRELLRGRARVTEWEVLRKDGSLVPVEVSACRLPNGHIQGIARDVSERWQAQRALQDSEEALRCSRDAIRLLAGRLLHAHEEERRRLSRELHDDLNQQLAALAIGISRTRRRAATVAPALEEELAQIQSRIVTITHDIRRISHGLHPAALETAGLVPALRSLCSEFSTDTGIDVRLIASGEVGGILPDAALCLYRVVQEALQNTAAHSGARRATVSLARTADGVELSVADAGRGMPSALPPGRRGLGLVSMEERVHLLRGQFNVRMRPGGGTDVRVWLPMSRAR